MRVVTFPEIWPAAAAANRAPICLPFNPEGSEVVSEADQAPATEVPVAPAEISTPRTSWRSQSIARIRGILQNSEFRGTDNPVRRLRIDGQDCPSYEQADII